MGGLFSKPRHQRSQQAIGLGVMQFVALYATAMAWVVVNLRATAPPKTLPFRRHVYFSCYDKWFQIRKSFEAILANVLKECEHWLELALQCFARFLP